MEQFLAFLPRFLLHRLGDFPESRVSQLPPSENHGDENRQHGACPGIFRHLPGFFLINGFSGHGFQHSPAAGRILADVMTDRDPGIDLSSFALERFAVGTLDGERNFV